MFHVPSYISLTHTNIIGYLYQRSQGLWISNNPALIYNGPAWKPNCNFFVRMHIFAGQENSGGMIYYRRHIHPIVSLPLMSTWISHRQLLRLDSGESCTNLE